jgi:RHS repeat-associated protein
MTNAAKATVWQASWKPWGEVQTLSGTNTNNLRFPGQYFQIETGLHYNHHRMYDPVTGRYTQPDPLRFVDGPSVYAYAKNSPFMYTDRDGLFFGRKMPGVPDAGNGNDSDVGGQCLSLSASGWPIILASDDPRSPMGRRGQPTIMPPGTNQPAMIGNRLFTGHALDQMQSRGITPSVVLNTLETVKPTSGNTAGSLVFDDSNNGVRVVINPNGSIKTIITIPRGGIGGRGGGGGGGGRGGR